MLLIDQFNLIALQRYARFFHSQIITLNAGKLQWPIFKLGETTRDGLIFKKTTECLPSYSIY